MASSVRVLLAAALLLAAAATRAQVFRQEPLHDGGLELCRLTVTHVDETGRTREGTLICNRRIANDLLDIFRELYRQRYPIHSVRPATDYGGSDERSMEANNTSAYNPRRTRSGGKSRHALGMAIDINPLWNPCVHLTGSNRGLIEPANATPYTQRTKPSAVPMISHSDLCYRLFRKHGFRWGGDWRSLKDYQHFEK